MSDGHRTRRLGGPIVKIATAVTALVLALLVAEAMARLLLTSPQVVEIEAGEARTATPGAVDEREQERGIDVLLDWSGHRGVRLNPNVRATIRNHSLSQQDVVIETNSLGLRHPELGPKTPGADRVLVLGDSITFCDYVAFEDSYTALLEEVLERDGRAVEVINAGLPGASTVDELSYYLELRDAVQPDTVLLAMYLNDAQNSGRFYTRSLPRADAQPAAGVGLHEHRGSPRRRHARRHAVGDRPAVGGDVPRRPRSAVGRHVARPRRLRLRDLQRSQRLRHRLDARLLGRPRADRGDARGGDRTSR